MTARDRELNWEAVRVFLQVARSGSLRRAADAEAVNHATVARAVGNLEKELGARLFERSRQGLQLTQAGEELIASAEKMEVEAHAIQRRVQGLDDRPAGRITVSVPPLLAYRFLGPHLQGFSDAYPQIELDMRISNTFADIARRETDISIRIAFEVDDDVVGRRLIQYKKGVYASPRYFEERPSLRVGDGAGAAWIGWSDEGQYPDWVKSSEFPRAPVRHVMPESVLHLEAAANHMGMITMPCFIGDADPRLRRAPGTVPQDDRSIWILFHADLKRTARVRAFVDYMAAAILELRPRIRGECA